MTDRIVGYVDRLGYLRCIVCGDGLRGDPTPVDRHMLDHPRDRCDICERPVVDVHGQHRGYLIIESGNRFEGINTRTRQRLTTGNTADQIRRAVDHYLDQSCRSHRACE